MRSLTDVIRARIHGDGPWLIGIGGAVAVGKSTIARALAAELPATIVSTDAFLLPNATLEARGIAMRKGFPESYDSDVMMRTLDALREGRAADVPVYSHERYDILDGELMRVSGDVIVIEGIMATQQPIRDALHVAVYIDTDPMNVRGWFVERFVRWTTEAGDDPASFYHGFSSMDPDTVRSIAEMTWDAINAVNLADHIAPSRERADIVVTKSADHAIEGIIER